MLKQNKTKKVIIIKKIKIPKSINIEVPQLLLGSKLALIFTAALWQQSTSGINSTIQM